MATLHIVSSSPFRDDRLASCLRLLGANDGLLLCGDATYALQAQTRYAEQLALLTNTASLFALDEDLIARNLMPAEPVQRLDYPAFVALTCRFDKVNSWL